ncbi:MAG TPA: thioredoxin domain-containing protein [Trebonia sp.]|jgi:hypothetical protein|nr:thioredoxin domain-containing protein [Trebonia sp.]
MANRLATATSPYLLQHADNPVDWWPWDPEAFAEARRRDVPVLISVGYAACHWCHVMAHESFEDPQVAALVNDSLVAIKVDREERPDVDAVYMTATQAMTGQGGWPMTVFATPDGHPLFCGTYFPKAQFAQLVQAVARAWQSDRDRLASDSARNVAILAGQSAALAGHAGSDGGEGGGGESGAGDGAPEPLTAGWLAAAAEEAVGGLQAAYDRRDGGFGRAPKFPPSMVIEFLLRHRERLGEAAPSSRAAREMAAGTLAAMAAGGMYDQVGGGFARYSVDATWTVPHFEKMLYDNALLVRAYTHWWRLDGDPLARRVAEETCDFMLRELRTPEGGLAASLDADSDDGAGHSAEGAFYAWTPVQLRELLGDDDGAFAARALGVTGQGTFEHGRSVLQRRSAAADGERLDRIRGELLAFREGRPRPARDDKVVAAWNGLAIAALAEAGALFDRPDFTAAATAAAGLLASVHLASVHLASVHLAEGRPLDGAARPGSGPRLARTSRDGAAGASAGQLEDYACVAAGLMTLFGVTGEGRWAALAGGLLDTVLAEFPDGAGGFYDAPADGEPLIFRPAEPLDGPTPSGTFAAADALVSWGALTGSARHRDAGLGALRVLAAITARYPRAAGAGLAVAEALLAGPVEIAVVGSPEDPRTGDLLRASLHAAGGGAVLALGDGASEPVPLLAGRGAVNGAPAAYVCRGFTCRLPVTNAADLREELTRASSAR